MYDNYYIQKIYENTTAIVGQNEDIIENQNTLIEQNTQTQSIIFAIAILIVSNMIHHLFDAGWKKY